MTELQFEQYMNKKIDSICMSIRHDFGLLNKKEQDNLRYEAKEYIHAIAKELPMKAVIW